ncbi:MAG: MgtC/SapB family protein, partial [Deltaproteobacteria bacterium]
TAACLWVASAIGLACGAGRYAPAIAVTVLAFLSLLLLKKVETRLKRDTYIRVKVWSADLEGQITRVEQAMRLYHIEVLDMSIQKDVENGTIALDFRLRHHTRKLGSELADGLACIQGIKRIWIE